MWDQTRLAAQTLYRIHTTVVACSPTVELLLEASTHTLRISNFISDALLPLPDSSEPDLAVGVGGHLMAAPK